VLVYRSGFMPRILGALLQVAGWAYVASTVAYFLVPAAFPAASVVMMAAAAAGEGAIVLWLLIKGVRAEPAAPRPEALGWARRYGRRPAGRSTCCLLWRAMSPGCRVRLRTCPPCRRPRSA
jgi:hypothetical protein